MLSMRDPESLRWVNQVITNSIGKSLIDEPISLEKKKCDHLVTEGTNIRLGFAINQFYWKKKSFYITIT
jgi:hypothetical protein